VADALVLPEDAVIVTVPTATPDTRPVVLTVASDAFDDAQVTVDDMSWVVPSLKVPIAASCAVAPVATETVAGVIAIDCRVGVLEPVPG